MRRTYRNMLNWSGMQPGLDGGVNVDDALCNGGLDDLNYPVYDFTRISGNGSRWGL